MSDYKKKIVDFMFSDIKKKENLNILEFGVREGISTKLFIDHVEIYGGKVYSVDIDDYSNISSSNKWKFIHSRDDNFDLIEKFIPQKVDLIYLDSFHNANHIEKIFYYYYEKLNENCFFYFDDISWLPYLKNRSRDSFNCEINNYETFNKLLEILRVNENNFDLYYSFVSSGMAKIFKKNNTKLNKPLEIKLRNNSLKNFARKLLKKNLASE